MPPDLADLLFEGLPQGALFPVSQADGGGFPTLGWCSTPVELRSLTAGRKDVYVPANPMRRPETGRGKTGDVSHLRALVVDLDIGKGGRYPATTDEALKIVSAFTVEPTLVVSTGSGGLQAWWVLAEPVVIDEHNRPWARGLVGRFEEHLRRHADSLGYEFDQGLTKDIAHVWRVPGSLHAKDPGNVRPVVVLDTVGTGGLVALETLVELLDAEGIPSYAVTDNAVGKPVETDISAFLSGLPDGEMCPAVESALAEAREALLSARHPAARDGSLALVRLGEQGHRGAQTALEALQATFLQSVSDRQARQDAAPREWDRMLAGAVGLVAARPTPAKDKGCCPAPGAHGHGRDQTSTLIALADVLFIPVRTLDGTPMVVLADRRHVALAVNGRGHTAAGMLKDAYYRQTGRWPSTTGVTAVCDYLAEAGASSAARPVHLRCYHADGTTYIDTGTDAWDVLVVDATGWRHGQLPDGVSFMRSPLTAPVPVPAVTGALDLLWSVLRVVPEDRPLVLAYVLYAWRTGTPQPVLLITGPEDSGKTENARLIAHLIDPTTHRGDRGGPLPRDERSWKAKAGAYRVVVVDNLSGLSSQASDLLCTVATGGESSDRALYTDGDLHLRSLRLPVILTSIDTGLLRGDLASRMLRLEVMPLTGADRMTGADLLARQDAVLPGVFTALLDLAVAVAKVEPTVSKDDLWNRNADYLVVLRAVDTVLGNAGAGEARLREQAADLSQDVVDSDPVANALLRLARRKPDDWLSRAVLARHTATELLDALNTETEFDGHGKNWPRTPKMLSERLTRVAPALRKGHGLVVEKVKSNGYRGFDISWEQPRQGRTRDAEQPPRDAAGTQPDPRASLPEHRPTSTHAPTGTQGTQKRGSSSVPNKKKKGGATRRGARPAVMTREQHPQITPVRRASLASPPRRTPESANPTNQDTP